MQRAIEYYVPQYLSEYFRKEKNWPIEYSGDYDFDAQGRLFQTGFLEKLDKDTKEDISKIFQSHYLQIKGCVDALFFNPSLNKIKETMSSIHALINAYFEKIKPTLAATNIFTQLIENTFIKQHKDLDEVFKRDLLMNFLSETFFYGLLCVFVKEGLGIEIHKKEHKRAVEFITKSGNLFHIFNHTFSNDNLKQEVTKRKFMERLGTDPKFSVVQLEDLNTGRKIKFLEEDPDQEMLNDILSKTQLIQKNHEIVIAPSKVKHRSSLTKLTFIEPLPSNSDDIYKITEVEEVTNYEENQGEDDQEYVNFKSI